MGSKKAALVPIIARGDHGLSGLDDCCAARPRYNPSMSTPESVTTMAVFLDLENIAIGAHEAQFPAFDVRKVIERLLLKGQIVVDALDLCYTKSHVDTFVILSGDSDFSPLVSKLRENAKTVIGVGVKKSTSDLFINNCDEFIYYDDLVRVEQPKKRRTAQAPAPATKSVNGTENSLYVERVVDLGTRAVDTLL